MNGSEALGARVVVGRLGPIRRRRSGPSPERKASPSTPGGPPRAVLVLALAISIERAIERGEVRDLADAARRLRLSRARLTQLGDLNLLSPRLQAELLVEGDGVTAPASERELRDLVRHDSWAFQEAIWAGRPAREEGRAEPRARASRPAGAAPDPEVASGVPRGTE